MSPELSKSAIERIVDLSWGTHVCYFYETKQDLLDTLALYFKAGLEGNEFCLWVIPESLTSEEATDALRKVVPDLDRHLAKGSIEIRSCEEWYREGGTFDLNKARSGWDEKLDAALARGYAGLKLTGDTAWTSDREWRSFQEYEKGLNDLVANKRMRVFCTYPLATSRAGEIFDVARAHQFAIAQRRGVWEVVEIPELKQAKAEIKKLNDELEKRVTERTRELAATNERLREYEKAVEGLDEMIVVIGRDYRYLLVNRAFLQYRGMEREQLIGQLIPEFQGRGVFDEFTKQKLDECFEGNVVKYELKYDYPVLGERDLSISYFPIEGPTGISRVACVMKDITESKRAEEQLRATSEQLRALSASLQSAREEEATRIAREIHDELGAALSSLRWDLEDVDEGIYVSGSESKIQELRKKIEGMMTLTDTTINSVRRIASELRPIALDALGLVEAIQWQARQFQDRTGIVVQCNCSMESANVSREQSTVVFRIFQEALTNILRHAHATKVEVQLNREDGVFIVTISDNGRGITDDEKTGQLTLGLLGMRERAYLIGGQIDITGSAGKGTVVTLRIPT